MIVPLRESRLSPESSNEAAPGRSPRPRAAFSCATPSEARHSPVATRISSLDLYTLAVLPGGLYYCLTLVGNGTRPGNTGDRSRSGLDAGGIDHADLVGAGRARSVLRRPVAAVVPQDRRAGDGRAGPARAAPGRGAGPSGESVGAARVIAQVGDHGLSVGGPGAPGHLRPQARRARRHPRRVQADRDPAARRPDRRACCPGSPASWTRSP